MRKLHATCMLDPSSYIWREGQTGPATAESGIGPVVRAKQISWLLRLGDVIIRAGISWPEEGPTFKCVNKMYYGTLEWFRQKEIYKEIPLFMSRPRKGDWDVWAVPQSDCGKIQHGRKKSAFSLKRGDVVYTSIKNIWNDTEIIQLPNVARDIRPREPMGFKPGDPALFHSWEEMTRARISELLSFTKCSLDKKEIEALVDASLISLDDTVEVEVKSLAPSVIDLGTAQIKRSGKYIIGETSEDFHIRFDMGRFADQVSELLKI